MISTTNTMLEMLPTPETALQRTATNTGAGVDSRSNQQTLPEARSDIKLLDDQQELLSLVTKRTNNYVIITDARGNIEWVNESFERFTDYTLEEVKGKKPKDFLQGPESDPTTRAFMSRRLSQGKSFSCEIVNYTKKGEKYWVHINCQPLKDKEGKVVRFFALMVNITEQKWLIESLIEARQKAVESDRLKSAFLANMSHEIRTPMNAIMGFAELLNRPNMPAAKRVEFANLIQQRSKDLLSIVNDILDISKIESGLMVYTPSVGSIQDLFDELLKNFSAEVNHLHNKSIEMHTFNELKGNENIVLADFARLKQVLINLLHNALKFTERGHIELGCTLQDDNTLVFRVRDTGIGIDASQHDLIFRPFQQATLNTHQQYGGTGLGLAIIQGILKLWNGKIWVDSEVGKGSTFYFSMPYLPKYRSRLTSPPELTDLPSRDLKILLVENDPFSASYIKEILKPLSATVFHIDTGNKALEVIAQFSPSVILLDLGLPDIDGMKVIEFIKKTKPEIFIIPITAFASTEHKTRAVELGCHAFLTKPLSQKRLIRTLTPILSQISNYRHYGHLT